MRPAAYSLTALTPHSLNPNAGGARNQKAVQTLLSRNALTYQRTNALMN